jgi:hypothetical protein
MTAKGFGDAEERLKTFVVIPIRRALVQIERGRSVRRNGRRRWQMEIRHGVGVEWRMTQG